MLSFVKTKLISGAVIALSTAVLISAGFYFGLFDELELKTFDLRAKYYSTHKSPPPDIAVILIDEASLRAMNPVVGRWPWPRSVHADVIDFLVQSGARAILFDILFTENERIPGAPPGTPGPNDIRLTEATGNAGNVFQAAHILVDTEDEYNKGLLGKPLPADFIKRFSAKKIKGIPPETNNNYYIPFSELYKVSRGIGIVEFAPDQDGIYRRTKPFRYYQGNFFPALSIAPLIDILKPEAMRQEEGKLILIGLQEGGLTIPLNTKNAKRKTVDIPLQKDGSYLINMYGDFKPYSMSGVLASIQKIKMGELEGLPVNPDEFKDKVIFIGASAVGVEDLKPTSIGGKIPGVLLHASVYSNIINKDFLKYTMPFVTYFSIFALSFMVAFAILWSRKTAYQTGLPLILAVLYISNSLWQFRNNIVYDLVAPVVSIIISWMGCFAYLSITEGKDKRKIRRMLGQYVSPAILTTVLGKASKDLLKAEVGSRERLTILFSDIRGFTSISETLEAEKVVEVLNGYLSEMVDVIFKHEGTLDKFIGDAVMAFWGAPVRVSEHGKMAVAAALEMLERLEIFNEGMRSRGISPLAIGIGINTGDVILGNIGSEKKLDYTIIGDNVNLASRMEGLTKEYGCPVLIAETTYEEVKGDFRCRVVDMVRVKGKKHPVKIYEPLRLPEKKQDVIDKIILLSETGFRQYLNKEWERAITSYSELLTLKNGDILSNIFIKRCESYLIEEPPAEWDGVYIMKSK